MAEPAHTAPDAPAEDTAQEETIRPPTADVDEENAIEKGTPAEKTADDERTEDADTDENEDDENLEDDPELRGILESLIFASDEPITFRQIKDIVAPDEATAHEDEEEAPRKRRKKKRRFTITRVKRAIDLLNGEYEESGRSFRIIEVSGGFAFQTTPAYGNWVGRLFAERSRRRLTQSALETLSIIAFRQPISKPTVEGIRGVNAEHVVKSLLERNLISIVGREDSPGRPLLYGTTKTFLRHFGLSSINDLPRPREIKDLLSSEEELAMHPIEEMDPTKAAELTRVSSQELERLFETAQLHEDNQNDHASASSASVEETSGIEDESASMRVAEKEGAPDSENDTDRGPVPPVLHVQFDSEEMQSPSEHVDASEGDTGPNDEHNDDAAAENDSDTPIGENPFDEDGPDETEEL